MTRLSPSQLSDRLTGSSLLWQSQVEDTIQEDGETPETGASVVLKYDMVSCVTPAPGGVLGQEHRLVRGGGIPSASSRLSDV